MPKGKKMAAGTIDAVARHFRVSSRSVRSWFGAGCPKSKPYRLDEIAEWRETRKRALAASGDDELQEQELRKLELDLQRAQERLLQEQNELVDRDTAIATVEQMFTEVIADLQEWPDGIAAEMPEQHRADVRDHVRHTVDLCVMRLKHAMQNIKSDGFCLESLTNTDVR